MSSDSFFICSYDDEIDKVNQYQRLSLEALEKIEIGKNVVIISFSNARSNNLSTSQSIFQIHWNREPQHIVYIM